ncbi:RNA methyltransferase [bacterium]|nr:MAG: RNA methyltransferase [bacterium]
MGSSSNDIQGGSMPEITSIHNPKIQSLRELMNKRSAREELGQFVVEGVRLAEEALMHGALPLAVYAGESLSERGQKLVGEFQSRGTTVTTLSDDVLQRISETENSQGILLTMPVTLKALPEDLNFVLILDQIRDPGNAGTMLRTAAASGVQAVLLAPGTTDSYAPKVVRAGMGAHFRLNLLSCTWPEIHRLCKVRERPLKLLLAESGDAPSVWQQDLRPPLGLTIGGEAEGAGEEARHYCDGLVSIPMPGGFESLNAAVAAGILLFEVVRQRAL